MEEDLSAPPTPDTLFGLIRNLVGLNLYALSLKIMPEETAGWLFFNIAQSIADAQEIADL